MCARHDEGVGDQLRGPASRIKVADEAVHSRLREGHVENERAVRLGHRVIVEKILKILADDKHVEKLVVNQLEMIDHLAGMRVFDLERDLYLLPGVKHGGSELQIEWIFLFIRNSEHQRHVAAG